jgi:hypothetical protein
MVSANEPARLALYNRLGEVLGAENAEPLMSSLPLQPAVELATKGDIVATRADLAELRTELRAEISDIHKALRTQTNYVIGAMAALTGICSAIVAVIT